MCVLRLIVQSAAYPCGHLDMQMDKFVEKEMHDLVHQMDTAKLEKFREGLVAQRLQVPKSSYEEASIAWPEIVQGTHMWDRAQQEVEALQALTREDLVDMYNTHLHSEGHALARLAIHIEGQAACEDAQTNPEWVPPLSMPQNRIADLESFKANVAHIEAQTCEMHSDHPAKL